MIAMAFSSEVAEELLVRAHRHCCVCHRAAGTKMEIHHIVPSTQGGDDSLDNGIPLCFDCHAEAETYNPKHPRGRRFGPGELKRHRDQWFAMASRPLWTTSRSLTAHASTTSVADLTTVIGRADLWNRDKASPFFNAVALLTDAERESLVAKLTEQLDPAASEPARWDAALVIEFLVSWDPLKVPAELLVRMAEDTLFTVRTSAAVAYFYLADAAPNEVPLGVLRDLAMPTEDWYVMTPAMSALVRLARRRPAAIDVLAEGTESAVGEVRDHFGAALRRLIKDHPAAANWGTIERLAASGYLPNQEIAAEWQAVLEHRVNHGLPLDQGIF